MMPLTLDHVMASGALPPAFPAVRIDEDHYWDGGIFSNTPIEAVLDDKPRRDSLIFSVTCVAAARHRSRQHLASAGPPEGHPVCEPRQEPHVARQNQIHRLRHVVRQLGLRPSESQRNDPEVSELLAYGCGTTMHLVRLLSPRLDREDHTKDIDFSRTGIRTRWQAGYAHAQRVLAEKPWEGEWDPLQGIVIHERME